MLSNSSAISKSIMSMTYELSKGKSISSRQIAKGVEVQQSVNANIKAMQAQNKVIGTLLSIKA